MDYCRIALQEATTTLRSWLRIKAPELTVIPCMTIWMDALREGRITPEEFHKQFSAAYQPPRDSG